MQRSNQKASKTGFSKVEFLLRPRLFLIFTVLILICAAHASGQTPFPLTNPDRLRYPPLHFKLPQAQRVTFDNGIILYIFPDHKLPILNIFAVIRTGAMYDPEGKEGLAELTGTVMRTGGIDTMMGSAVDEELDLIAASVKVSMGMESGSATLSVLRKDIDAGLKIFSGILMHPTFEENRFLLAKNLKTEELRRISDDPQKLTFREFSRILYRGNPRGRLASVSSVKNIARDDLIQFHKRFFHPANVMIAVSGDISREEAIAKVNQYLGTWHVSEKHDEIPPPVVNRGCGIFYLAKDLPQSIIITGHLAPGEGTPDFYPFTVLDFILGSGGFRSRIFGEIRNNLGLAYSVGSFYRGKSNHGVFGAYAMTKATSTVKVLSLIRSIIEDVKKGGVSGSELALAKKSINNSFIFSFLSADQIAYQQLMTEYNKLHEDYLVTYRNKIEKVNEDDIKRVALKYLSQEGTVTLVVGNENAFDQPLSLFGKVNKIEGEL
ncbi:MAG: pitrilysin family protein [Syntrophales bacterium]|nr:pitrilysin family protein [Syntrophales bacterium]